MRGCGLQPHHIMEQTKLRVEKWCDDVKQKTFPRLSEKTFRQGKETQQTKKCDEKKGERIERKQRRVYKS